MRVATRSAASRLESGSSKRKSLGVRTMARPMATRWRWPPESSAGRRARRGSSESICEAVATRWVTTSGLAPDCFRPRAMLSRTVRWG